MNLDHLELDSSDDLAVLLGKMCLATNQKKEFTEKYRIVGKALNDAEVNLIRAKTEGEKWSLTILKMQQSNYRKSMKWVMKHSALLKN